MAEYRLARRYAKGLLAFAKETQQEHTVIAEMSQLHLGIKQSRDLSNFLHSPILDSKKKQKIAKELFKDFSKTTQTFVQLLIQHRREAVLDSITKQFHLIYNTQNQIHKATISSARKLTTSEIDSIIQKAKQSFSGDWTFEVENQVNQDLLGGFILRVGDKQLDASVRNKLNKLRKEFDKNDYIPKI